MLTGVECLGCRNLFFIEKRPGKMVYVNGIFRGHVHGDDKHGAWCRQRVTNRLGNGTGRVVTFMDEARAAPLRARDHRADQPTWFLSALNPG